MNDIYKTVYLVFRNGEEIARSESKGAMTILYNLLDKYGYCKSLKLVSITKCILFLSSYGEEHQKILKERKYE